MTTTSVLTDEQQHYPTEYDRVGEREKDLQQPPGLFSYSSPTVGKEVTILLFQPACCSHCQPTLLEEARAPAAAETAMAAAAA